MKIYALYLPQFHETLENNEWWGKGFTEWTNVKKAKQLFKSHTQPIHPLNDNYYNLLEKSTVEWQTQLMHKYGIDGFVYYHYYFNGKKMLEKPAENLLKWKDINQPFFFNWANHTWYRSWNGSREVLIQQSYGKKEDWRRHFEYLIQFFQDDRYVKINNMPIFVVYDNSFKEKEEMFLCFDEWCREYGFDGLYLVEESFNVNKIQDDIEDENICRIRKKIYYSQPAVGRLLTINKSKFSLYKEKVINKLIQNGIIKKIRVLDGDKLLKLSMIEKIKRNGIPGLFFSWDNTPRHGKRGYIIDDISKKMFEEYMNYYNESDFIIVNAWNEWCEGMILEPTEEKGYKYLEWINEWRKKNDT